MKRATKYFFIGIVASIFFAGCGGEGTIRLKGTESKVVEAWFFTDKYGDVELSGGEYFIDGKSLGEGTKGWKQLSVSPGKYKATLKAPYGAIKDVFYVYDAGLNIQDKQIEEYIFDTAKRIQNGDFKMELRGDMKKANQLFLANHKDVVDVELHYYKNQKKFDDTIIFKSEGTLCETRFGELMCPKNMIVGEDTSGIFALTKVVKVPLGSIVEYEPGCFKMKLGDQEVKGCKQKK